MIQRELFESENTPPKQADLVIKKADKPQLSKNQKAFNRLVKKLERLKKEYENLRATLDEGLNFFAGSIHPKEVQLANALKECIKAFFSFYKARTGLSATQKRLLKEMIERTLENVLELSNDKPDEDMKAIFEEIYGMSMVQAASEEFEEMKWEMQEMFEDAGLDFDFDDFNFSSNEEEMMAKFKAMQEEAFREQEEKQKKIDARKKTKKQIEREEKQKKIEEARQRNIGIIYKQLAKTIHPDLEKDSERRLQKEELMKQLTVAYENNDLHTLLKLELEWLNKDEDNISKLTDEKLAIYNETLKEQVLNAETEINMLLVHERYLPLQRYVRNPETTYMEMRKAEVKLRRNMATAEKDAAALKGAHALKYVKELITDYKRTLDKEKKDMIKDLDMDLAMFIDLMGRNNR